MPTFETDEEELNWLNGGRSNSEDELELQRLNAAVQVKEPGDSFWTAVPKELGKGIASGWFGANKAVGSVLEYVSDLTGWEEGKKLGSGARTYWEETAEPYKPAVQNFTDIKDAGDAARWAAWNVGQMGSQMAVTAPFMLTGGPAAVAVKGGAGRAAKIGQYLLDWAKLKPMDIPIGILEAGQVAEGQLKEVEAGKTNELHPLRALAGAFVATKLEELGVEKGLAKFLKFGPEAKAFAEKGLAKRVGQAAATGAVGEGAEEFFQNYAEQFGINPKDLFSKEQFLESINAAAAGAVGGLFLGAGGGAVAKKTYQTKEGEKKEGEQPPPSNAIPADFFTLAEASLKEGETTIQGIKELRESYAQGPHDAASLATLDAFIANQEKTQPAKPQEKAATVQETATPGKEYVAPATFAPPIGAEEGNLTEWQRLMRRNRLDQTVDQWAANFPQGQADLGTKTFFSTLTDGVRTGTINLHDALKEAQRRRVDPAGSYEAVVSGLMTRTIQSQRDVGTLFANVGKAGITGIQNVLEKKKRNLELVAKNSPTAAANLDRVNLLLGGITYDRQGKSRVSGTGGIGQELGNLQVGEGSEKTIGDNRVDKAQESGGNLAGEIAEQVIPTAAPGMALNPRQATTPQDLTQAARAEEEPTVTPQTGAVELPTAEEIAQAAHEAATSPLNNLPEPTEKEKETGVYKKGHFSLHGLNISIENPTGSTRTNLSKEQLEAALKDARAGSKTSLEAAISDWDKGDIEGAALLARKAQSMTATDLGLGKIWNTRMKDHYGQILGYEGNDKDKVDVFVGEHPESNHVFIVNQNRPETGTFDEHKVMMGYTDEQTAKEAYLRNYEKGWKGLGSIVPMSIDQFKTWLDEGNAKKGEAKAPAGAAEKIGTFEEGDRVVFTEGGYKGRHGVITKKNVIVMRAVFGGGKESRDVHYDVTTDNGVKTFGYDRNMEAETERPDKVIPDIDYHGNFQAPDAVYRMIENYRRDSKNKTEAAARARKPENKRALYRQSEDALNKSDEARAVFDRWAAAYPEEAEKIRPTKKEEVKPSLAKPGAAIAYRVKSDKDNLYSDYATREDAERDIEEGKNAPFPRNEYIVKVVNGKEEKTAPVLGEKTLTDFGLTLVKSTTNNGKPVWNLSGNTKEHATDIKAAGGRWYGPKKVWSFYGEEDPSEKILKRLNETAGYNKQAGAEEKPTEQTPSSEEKVKAVLNAWATFYRSDLVADKEALVALYKGLTDREKNLFQQERADLKEKIDREKQETTPVIQAQIETAAQEAIDEGYTEQEVTEALREGEAAGKVEGAALSEAEIRKEVKKIVIDLGQISWTPQLLRLARGVSDALEKLADESYMPEDFAEQWDIELDKVKLQDWANGVADIAKGNVSFARTTGEVTFPEDLYNADPEVFDALNDYIVNEFNKQYHGYLFDFGLDKEQKPSTMEEGGRENADTGNGLQEAGAAEDDRNRTERPSPEVISATEEQRQAESVPERARKRNDAELRGSVSRTSREGDRAEGTERPSGEGAATHHGRSRDLGENAGDVAGVQRSPDYRIQPGELNRSGSWRNTAQTNLDAVELVKKLEQEKRQATPEEQAILVKYTGWGASELANNLFPGVAQSGKIQPGWLYGEKVSWKPLVERLAALFSEEEIKTAARSTQYAHYTSESVIRSIYKALERFGFTGGKILEPGMGVGHFAGLIPESMKGTSKYTGIEMDHATATIAKYLYPRQNIIEGDFITRKFPNDFFDLAIGNPPFSKTVILSDPDYKKYRLPLHEYFFAKALDKVRPGGLLVFVTSRYLMDKQDAKFRNYLAERADLIGAVRLPQTAFVKNAGTEVVTDVLFLRKKDPNAQTTGEDWTGLKEIPIEDKQPVLVNEYYVARPEMVLGRHSREGSMYRADEYTVLPMDGDIEQHFADAIEKLPQNVYNAMTRPAQEIKQAVVERDYNPANRKEGGLYVSDKGELMVVEYGSGVPLSSQKSKLTPKDVHWLQDYVKLRDAIKQAQYDQLTEGPWEKSLKEANKVYDVFVKKHGHISSFSTYERKTVDEDGNEQTTEYRRFKNASLWKKDVENSLVTAVEEITNDGAIVKAPFLLGRTIKTPTRPQVSSAADALAVTLDEVGHLNLPYVAQVAGVPEDEIVERLGDLIFEVPGQTGYQLADEYLSGDVVTKLEEARQAAAVDKKYEKNVKALEKVQPTPLTAKDVTVALGANWIPIEVYDDFINEVLDIKNAGVFYKGADNTWKVGPKERKENAYRWQRRSSAKLKKQQLRSSTTEWGTQDRGPNEILEAVLNNATLKITRQEHIPGGGTKTYVDQAATAQVNEIAKKMRQRFATWVWEDAERAGELLALYNRKFNNLSGRRFDGSHLTLPGVSLKWKLHDHQKRAIWRIIQSGNTYLAHAVGAGKTIEMISAGMEMKRLGLIRKPLYVVPNHMLQQFANEFQELYPLAHVMVADEENFHTDNRRRFVAQAALNNPDAIVMTHSSFGLLKIEEETIQPVRDAVIQELRDAMEELEESDEGKFRIKRMEQRIEQTEQRFDSMTAATGKDDVVTFEDLGADFLFVDEAHNFRKLDFTTNRQTKGIDPNGSRKAMDLYIKTLWLESQKPGRSHVFASGTPVTNTLGELYTLMRFFTEGQMELDGTRYFDAWANNYGVTALGYEMNAAGRYEVVERFAEFVNVPELMSRVRTFMDVLSSSQLGAFVNRPEINGGHPEIVITPPSQALKDYQTTVLMPRIEISKKWKPSPGQKGNPDPMINIITDGRLASLDLRFVQKGAKNDPNSKLNKFIDGIIATYKDTKGNVYTDDTGKAEPIKGAAQIVFYNHGFGQMVAQRRGFDARAWMMGRLKDAGIPASQVAWIDDYDTAPKKEAMFKEVRHGHKRILIGSAKKMGTGVNVQKRLAALHYLDPPWYPADVEQPDGRIIRQGNQNKVVDVKRYATKGSYDATMWQMVSRKSRFIEQAFTGDASVRKLEDISEASQYEMAAALASGDERVIQLAGLRADTERLNRLNEAHHKEQINLSGARSRLESNIKWGEGRIKDLKDAMKTAPNYVRLIEGKIGSTTYDNRAKFGTELIKAFNAAQTKYGDTLPQTHQIATINGLPLEYEVGRLNRVSLNLRFTDKVATEIQAGNFGETDPEGLTTRIVNKINNLSSELHETETQLGNNKNELAVVRKKLGAPFEFAQELLEKTGETARLEAELAAEGQEAKPEEIRIDEGPQINKLPSFLRSSDLSLTFPGRPVYTVAQVERMITAIRADYPNIGTVKVVPSVQEFPVDLVERAGGLKEGEQVFAVYDPMTDTTYVVAGAIGNAQAAQTILLHEIFHRSVLAITKRGERQIIHQLVRKGYLGTPVGEKIIRDYGLDLAKEEDRDTFSKELMAHMAQTGENPTLYQRIIAIIRAAIRRVFPNLKYTDADVKKLIEKSFEFAKRGKTDGQVVQPWYRREENAHYLLGGKNAKGANLTALDTASQMEAEGKSKAAIWKETGWIKYVDGLWRWEIDDSKARFATDIPEAWFDQRVELPLSRILSHPDLFVQYPQLANIKVRNEGTGQFSAHPPRIAIPGSEVKSNYLGATLHEIQHWIQQSEGFAKGGNPNAFFESNYENEEIIKAREQYEKAPQFGPERKQAFDNYLKVKADESEKAYIRLAGEAEAREVMRRAGMTAEERAANPPSWDGIPEDQLIVRMEGGTTSQMSLKKGPGDTSAKTTPQPGSGRIYYAGTTEGRPQGKYTYLTTNQDYAKHFGDQVREFRATPENTLDLTQYGERSVSFETLQKNMKNLGVKISDTMREQYDDVHKPMWQWIRKYPEMADAVKAAGYDSISHMETFTGKGRKETVLMMLDKSKVTALSETRPGSKPEGGEIVRFPRKNRTDNLIEGQQVGNIVPLSHIDETHANGQYFPMAESADGDFFWHSGSDFYVTVNHPEKFGMKSKGRFSIYLPNPQKEVPEQLLKKAREFSLEVDELKQIREYGKTIKQMKEDQERREKATKRELPAKYQEAFDRVREGNAFIERLAKRAIAFEEASHDFKPTFENKNIIGWNETGQGNVEDTLAKRGATILKDEPFALKGIVSGVGFFSSRHLEYRLPSGEVRHAYIFDKSMEDDYAQESIISKAELSPDEVFNVRQEVNEESKRHFEEHQQKRLEIEQDAPTSHEKSLIWMVGNVAHNKKFQEGALEIAQSGTVPAGTFVDVYNDDYKPIAVEAALLWVKIKHPEISQLPNPSRSPGEGEQPSFKKQSSAYRDVETGLYALRDAVKQQKDMLASIMNRDLGPVSLYYGNPAKDEGGLLHIIAQRTFEGSSDIAYDLAQIIKAIVLGKKVREYGGDIGRADIEYGDYIAILSKQRFGNKEVWLLTGFKKREGVKGESYNPRDYARLTSGSLPRVVASLDSTIDAALADVKVNEEPPSFLKRSPESDFLAALSKTNPALAKQLTAARAAEKAQQAATADLDKDASSVIQTILTGKGPNGEKIALPRFFKPNNFFENTVRSPEFWTHPKLAAIVRLFTHTRDTIRHTIFHNLTTSDGHTISDDLETLRKKNRKAYDEFAWMYDYADAEYQRDPEVMGKLRDPATSETERAALVAKEQERFIDYARATKHVSDGAVAMWREVQAGNSRAFDLMSAQMQELLARYEEKMPLLSEEERKKALSVMEKLQFAQATIQEWRGFYAHRYRPDKPWAVVGRKLIADRLVTKPFAFDATSKNEGRFALRDRAAYTDWITATPETALRYGLPSFEGINYVMGKTAETAQYELQSIRFKLDQWTEETAKQWWQGNRDLFDPEYEYIRKPTGRLGAGRTAAQLQREGWQHVRVIENNRVSEKLYQNLRIADVASAIKSAASEMEDGKFTDAIIDEMADFIRERGFRSSMIHRKQGRAVRGYEIDPIQRVIPYYANVAGGLAKAQIAREAMRLQMDIDPRAERNVYDTAHEFIEENLRNLDEWDRIIAFGKSVATFKYLGFSPRTVAVNVTAIATTAPMALHTYAMGGKGSMMAAAAALVRAGRDAKNIMLGRKLTDKDEQAFVDRIQKEGYDDPQYMMDAMGKVQGAYGRAWSQAMKGAMWMFGKSEQWNRVTTLLAAWRLAKQRGLAGDELFETAVHSSDRAHGVYKHATMPKVAWGTGAGGRFGQMFYVYMKFSHTYLQTMYEVAKDKRDYKAFVWGLAAPVILAGAAAGPFKDLLVWLLNAAIRTGGGTTDVEQAVWNGVRSWFGTTGETIGRHGLTGAAGLDISSSLSIGVGIPRDFWEFAGAIGGVGKDIQQAGHFLMTNQWEKAAEKALPTAAANILRAFREGRTQVVTEKGRAVFDETGAPLVPTTAERIARGVGFRSSHQAVLTERRGEAIRREQVFQSMRDNVYEQARAYLSNPERTSSQLEDLQRAVIDYNRKVAESGMARAEVPLITGAQLARQAIALRKPTKKEWARVR